MKLYQCIHTLYEYTWNPYRFLISSLGLPTFFLRIANRAVANMPPMTAHRPDIIITHNNRNNYFDTLNSLASIEF